MLAFAVNRNFHFLLLTAISNTLESPLSAKLSPDTGFFFPVREAGFVVALLAFRRMFRRAAPPRVGPLFRGGRLSALQRTPRPCLPSGPAADRRPPGPPGSDHEIDPVPRSGHRQCRARSYRWGRGNRVFVDEGLGGGFRAFFRRSGLPVGAPCLPRSARPSRPAQEDLDEYAARQGLSLLSEAGAGVGSALDGIGERTLAAASAASAAAGTIASAIRVLDVAETEEPCSWTEQDHTSARPARTARRTNEE